MRTQLKTIALVLAISAAALATVGLFPSNVDPAHRFAWSENIGWTNWQHDSPLAGDGVFVDFDHLAGFAWAENVGWLNMGNGGGPYPNDPGDSSTFGVNLNPDTGDLSGFAWGENIGWINFDTSAARGMDGARFDNHNRRFVGFVWGENIGWINLNDAEHFVAIGPCDHGDFECDGDVELDDYAAFKSVFFGPNVPVESTAFDADADADIDLFDFSAMQTLITVQ